VEETAPLTAEEQRVLGCLIEKGATTPETYPLTMNALITACNQTSNRDPVVSYREGAVTAALTSLRERKLIRIVYPAHARVTKYRHVLDEVWALSPQELAVLAVLLLRGGQTQNELVARTERYGDPGCFDDLGGVPGVLDRMARRPEPLARMVERRAGQREDRYIHLLGTTDVPDTPGRQGGQDGHHGSGASGGQDGPGGQDGQGGQGGQDGHRGQGSPEQSSTRGSSMLSRILDLETETANLRRELASIREWLEDLLGESNPPPESRDD
jgi:uncharacterized protein YceH (UPF0502 family)